MRGACAGELRCCSSERQVAKGGRVAGQRGQTSGLTGISAVEDAGVSIPVGEKGTPLVVLLSGVKLNAPPPYSLLSSSTPSWLLL